MKRGQIAPPPIPPGKTTLKNPSLIRIKFSDIVEVQGQSVLLKNIINDENVIIATGQ